MCTKETPTLAWCFKKCFFEEVVLVGVIKRGQGRRESVLGSRNGIEEEREQARL